jgi:hypothetical protein
LGTLMSNKQTYTPEELAPHADATVDYMIKKGIPLTRENYLTHAYGADLPPEDGWNYEHEMMIPQPFQDPEAVKPETPE